MGKPQSEEWTMALTESKMLPLGTEAPDFSLADPSGKVHSLSDFEGTPALLVVFMCNHCPYVVHIKKALADFAREYAARGVAIVGISANDPAAFPADAPDKMAEDAKAFGYGFPYLFDESQEVAKAYRAACTPDFFLFDGDRRLVYRGQFDSSRPRNDVPVTGEDLRRAVDAVLDGAEVPEPQVPSIGCSIKWRPGNAPAHAG
jgi:peroxiredoxin